MENNHNFPPTVLVVDDEYMNRELMEAVLETAGYKVMLAGNVQRALQLIQETAPSLILVDVRLRYDTEGYEFCQKIKSSPETREIKVAMLTAMDSPQDRYMAEQAGADDFISRMLDTPHLLERIAALVELAQK